MIRLSSSWAAFALLLKTTMNLYRRRDTLRALMFCILAVLALACGGCKRSEPQPNPAREDKLVVFAAASLREAFMAMGDELKKSRPGVEVTFNFAGSHELRTQIEHGAAADVFASADQKHMNELQKAAKVSNPVVFARNEPVVIVAKEKAATIRQLADLPLATRLVIGGPEVPIGRYTLQILDNASRTLGADFRSRVEALVVSREPNVRQVLAKVSLGEADAGIVYRTDVAASKDQVSVVVIPPDINVIAEYPIAVITGAPHPELARAWVDLVLSPAGQDILTRVGFMSPKPSGPAP